jgi:hypothetical protein
MVCFEVQGIESDTSPAEIAELRRKKDGTEYLMLVLGFGA